MGQWALFIGITTFLEGAKDGLMKNALVHYLNAVKEEEHVAVKSSSLLLNLIVTGVFAILVYFLSSWISELLSANYLFEMLQFYAINLVALVFFSHFNFIQQAKVAYFGILMSFIGRQGLLFFTVLFTMGINHIDLTLLELVKVQLAGIVLGTIISYLFTRKYLLSQLSVKKEWFGKIWRFGRYGMFTNISVSIITTTDHMMLGGMISTSSVAVYNVAVKITNLFNLPSVALSGVLLPESVKSATAKNEERLKELFEKAVASTLAGLIPSVLLVLLFPETIVLLIAGEGYIMAKEVLTIIILTTLIMPYFQSYGMIVNALGKPRLDFIFITIVSMFNIGANYFLIKLMGISGAAFASLLTHLVGLVFILIILRSLIGIKINRVGKRLFEIYANLFNILLNKLKVKSSNNEK